MQRFFNSHLNDCNFRRIVGCVSTFVIFNTEHIMSFVLELHEVLFIHHARGTFYQILAFWA